MPLLKYELKKLLGRRGLVTAILLLLALNVLIICVSYSPGNYTVKNDGLCEVYRLYLDDKEAFDARYNELLTKSELGEYESQELSYFQKVESDVSYILEYPNKASAISASAKRLLNESVRSGYSEGDYIYDYQKNTIELYSSAAEKVRFPLTPLSGWSNYFNHTVVNYLLFAVIILLVSSVYVPERVGAIYPIIRTARKGRAPLSMAKLFAVLIGTSAVTLLFFASSFAVFALREGFSAVMSPIQAIRTFETCPYIITVGEYFALNTLIRLGAFLLFGCVCALFASAFCDYVGSFAASASVPTLSDADKTASDGGSELQRAILKGFKDKAAEITKVLLSTHQPLEIVNGEIIPALNQVGEGFENKTVYLPQLLMSAEAAKAAFEVIKSHMAGSANAAKRGPIVIATVHGDIHDIGKNIVKLLLENYGFDVIDLGKDVPPRAVVDAVVSHHAPLAGLSALMTTTVPAMEETIRLLRQAAPYCKIIVGGAVLTRDYADRIGADMYAKDAMEAVRYAEEII